MNPLKEIDPHGNEGHSENKNSITAHNSTPLVLGLQAKQDSAESIEVKVFTNKKQLLDEIAVADAWQSAACKYVEIQANAEAPLNDTIDEIRAALGRNLFHQNGLDSMGTEIKTVVHDEHKKYIAKRRAEQAAQTERIAMGHESNTPSVAELLSVEEMVRRFAYINEGGIVIDIATPKKIFKNFSDFDNAYAASRTYVQESRRKFNNAFLWKQNHRRKTFDTLTFKPGGQLNVLNPNGVPSLNLWRPRGKVIKPADFEVLILTFLDHVHWLFGDMTQGLLDWLAHLEQKPGQLPHHHYLHTAKHHGMGRNWVMGVLARVWRGYVAPAFDLMGTLESGFNGRLSQCLLACVDEINETGGLQWKHANALRQLLTADQREINPKYGRRWVEYVYTRFLLFSNHGDALPLGQEDRRIIVVECEQEPKTEWYYKQLYDLLENHEFIASVIVYLQERDITGFNPGMRAPMTEAKRKLIDHAKSENDRVCEALVDCWPVDVIYLSEVKELLRDPNDASLRPTVINQSALMHSFNRSGMQRYAASDQIRDSHGRERAWILRNHAIWQVADIDQIRDERNRIKAQDKEATLYGNKLPDSSRTLTTSTSANVQRIRRKL